MKLVVFDFCETLVNFQTADEFCKYILSIEKPIKLKLWKVFDYILSKSRVFNLLNKLYPSLNINKRYWLYALKNFQEERLKEYSKKFLVHQLEPKINKHILDKLEAHHKENDKVVLISGGYEPYLKEFCSKYSISSFSGTKVQVKNNKVTGYFEGPDCLGQAKIDALVGLIDLIQYKDIIVYSDSPSDLPLFKLATKAYVISRRKSQTWIKNYGFEEIIIN